MALKTIGITIFSISMLISFGLTSNQAFAGGCSGPEDEGVACGPPEPDNECSNQNTCTNDGRCLARNVAAGTMCNADSDACTTDQCDGAGACVAGPSECVGGEMIPIGTTSLILAGTQSAFSWMIPITVSAVGITIVIARKFSKYQPE